MHTRITLVNKIIVRKYQTKMGIFGYLPRKKGKYKVPDEVLKLRSENSNFYRLVTAFHEHGHRKALINPVAIEKIEDVPELNFERYGLKLEQRVPFKGLIGKKDQDEGTVQEAVQFLEETYAKNTGYEFSYLPEEEREWFIEKIEGLEPLPIDTEKRIMEELVKSQVFDNFMANKFSSVKRYGGEGAESLMAVFYQLLECCQKLEISHLVMGLSHRGRLNLCVGLLKQRPASLFRIIRGQPMFPPSAKAIGDVLPHLFFTVDIGSVHISVLPNPSHLDAGQSVSMGKTRAKQMMMKEGDYGNGDTVLGEKIINIQVHGDAAYIGQGINQETLNLQNLPHFTTGGTIHLIVNNQLGFTTPSDRGRSCLYASDLAKMTSTPVIHVNGDYPDKVAQATNIAIAYQRAFRKDIFIDLNCYRQQGHNELDDPTFTNPAIYAIIHGRKYTVPDLYANKLIDQKTVSGEDVENLKKNHYAELNKELQAEYTPEETYFKKQWQGMTQAGHNLTVWDTGLDTNILRYIGIKSVQYPDNFHIHNHLKKTYITQRLNKMNSSDEKIDWATAESLAIGSLLYHGFNVRLSGQDVGRGTFSQRHVMLVDQTTNDTYIPLNHLTNDQVGKLEVVNTPLSEEAILGFEYGMSLENPKNLIIWEAQFGDFANGAQIIIDTFVSSGEAKWMMCSGLVMLLPHGYDGGGPEHSSCRLERFLQLTDSKETQADGDDVNLQVVYPTTPAQYFHLLRRQMIRNYRKPLIVVGPKVLLRLPEATSKWQDFHTNSNFENIIPDDQTDPSKVSRVIFTAGKHFYNLDNKRKEMNRLDTAIIRIESLCPFPTHDLQKLTEKFVNAKEYIWCQEEPRNMGAWSFVYPRFKNLVGIHLEFRGLDELPVPALVGHKHYEAQNKIFEDAFK